MASRVARLLCPKCSTTFTAASGEQPVCPNCGYTTSAPAVTSGAAPTSEPAQQPTYGQGYAYPGQPPPAVGGYSYQAGVQQPAMASGTKKNGMAVAAFVLGLLGWVLGWIPPLIPITVVMLILAIVFGSIANGRVNEDPGVGGKGFAIAGLVLGILGLVTYLIVILFVMLFFAAIFGSIF